MGLASTSGDIYGETYEEEDGRQHQREGGHGGDGEGEGAQHAHEVVEEGVEREGQRRVEVVLVLGEAVQDPPRGRRVEKGHRRRKHPRGFMS